MWKARFVSKLNNMHRHRKAILTLLITPFLKDLSNAKDPPNGMWRGKTRLVTYLRNENRMARQWAETLVKIRGNLSDISNRPVCLDRGIIYWHIFHSNGFHHICNIICRLDCRYSPQNVFNAKNFNPHKKTQLFVKVPICTQRMQRTWLPEAGAIIVTGPYLEKWYQQTFYFNKTKECAMWYS